MRVLIDRNGIQADQHLKDRLRLTVFLTELLADSYWVAFSSKPTLTAEELRHCDVLVITTRSPEECDHTPPEIANILHFVRNGGGLLLMTNHADRPGGSRYDFRKHDAKLASEFGVVLEK